MNIDLGSFAYGGVVLTGGNTPSWGTSLGQSQPDYKFTYPGAENVLIGMMYCSVPLQYISLPLGKGGRVNVASEMPECQLASLFKKVYINGTRIDYPFLLVLVRETSASHTGRRTIKYSDKIAYNSGISQYNNQQFVKQARLKLGLADEACWFIYSMEVINQDELHMYAAIVDANNSVDYPDSQTRRQKWLDLLDTELEDNYQTYARKQDEFRESEPLQQIFYGAPGTGKSKTIKDKTEIAEKENRVFRTTFHPDSDYSTFVGCYKPGMKSGDRIYSAEELAVKLKEIKNSGVTYPCHKFAAQYWRSLKDLSADAIKQILNACGFTESMNVEVSKGVAIGQEYLNKDEDGKIVYTFTPQAFTNAYVKAWSTTEDVYLIIEEINRGNCAQIFGDLFQLLDRGDNGLSEYPIEADTDLRNYIAKELENSTRSDFPNGVKEGEKLILPSNLYIWATMNTSDQSLFPIDSAFKRRWDWQYVPIHDGRKGWQIEADGKRYDWWQFVDAMNDKIGTATYSEDKKLGYFFCKAKDGVIDAETFVGKVVFYIWNDVFKDFAEEAGNLFKDVDGSMLSFNKFYTIGTDGKRKVVEPKITILMQNLGVEPISTSDTENDDEPEEDEDGNDPSSYTKNYDKFSVNGEGKWGKNRLPYECLKKYVEMNPGLNADEVLNNWKSLNVNVPHFIESKVEYESRTDNSKRSYYVECGDTIIYVAHNGYGSNGKVYEFIAAINNANWGIKLAKVMA